VEESLRARSDTGVSKKGEEARGEKTKLSRSDNALLLIQGDAGKNGSGPVSGKKCFFEGKWKNWWVKGEKEDLGTREVSSHREAKSREDAIKRTSITELRR